MSHNTPKSNYGLQMLKYNLAKLLNDSNPKTIDLESIIIKTVARDVYLKLISKYFGFR